MKTFVIIGRAKDHKEIFAETRYDRRDERSWSLAIGQKVHIVRNGRLLRYKICLEIEFTVILGTTWVVSETSVIYRLI
jgi:hypothetical protein